jgi:hypothetical protein
VRIDLQELFPQPAASPPLEAGDVDAISGGAITHALLFCLLRIPGLRIHVRVIEEQHAKLSNLNRYATWLAVGAPVAAPACPIGCSVLETSLRLHPLP